MVVRWGSRRTSPLPPGGLKARELKGVQEALHSKAHIVSQPRPPARGSEKTRLTYFASSDPPPANRSRPLVQGKFHPSSFVLPLSLSLSPAHQV